jgi:hypothetical protein
MEAAPLASLSLTHVHYVHPPSPSPTLQVRPQLTPHTEPPRPNIVPLRLARARPPSSLRRLRDSNMVDARSRNSVYVRRANGMRGIELLTEEVD